MLGTNRDGRRPGRRRGFGRGQHAGVSTARQRGLPTPIRRRLVEHHSRGRGPSLPANRRPAAGMNNSNTDSRGNPVEFVAQR
jgi:hypothetical protein